MTLPAIRTVPFLALLSAIALAIALVSQYRFGYAPCELCILQRWAHGAVAALGFGLFFRLKPRLLLLLQTIAIATALALSIYHVGVEQHWWAGSRACVGEETQAGTSLADLTRQILEAPVVRCDEIRWTLFGLSMAVYDAALTVGMLLAAAFTFARRR